MINMAAPRRSSRFRRATAAAVTIVAAVITRPCQASGLSDFCPVPCPVNDSRKVARYRGEVSSTWQQVQWCRQIALQYFDLLNAIGPNGPLAAELTRLPGKVSSVFDTFRAALPAMLSPGDLADPRTAAEILKTSLFDPGGSGANRTTDRVILAMRRANQLTTESLNALATGLHAYSRLVDVAADGGRQTVLASQAGNMRSDLAANTAARQALVDNVAGLHQLLSSWAAAEALASAAVNTTTLGRVPAATAPSSPLSTRLQNQAGELETLRQVRATVNQMDATVSALTALHNERRAAKAIVAQYPGLWNTVESHDAAIAFRDAAARTAAGLLGRVFVDGQAAFQAVTVRLLALDTTSWTDDGAKALAATTAVGAVVAALRADPVGFGGLPGGGLDPSQPTADAKQFFNLLQDSLLAWLEDDKLERFWRPLRHNADLAIGRLDSRLGQIASRRGFDIVGPAAAAEEAELQAQFDWQVRQLAAASSRGFGDDQKAAVASMVGAMQRAVAGVRGDPGTDAFVTVAWPQ